MKRGAVLAVAVLATVSMFTLGSVAVAKPGKTNTTAGFVADPNDPSSMVLEGKVKSNKSACKKKRKVTLQVFGPIFQQLDNAGSTKTDKKGNWLFAGYRNLGMLNVFSGLDLYNVVVKKKKKKGKTICKGGESKTVTTSVTL